MSTLYTVTEFCREHRICRATFYRLVRVGVAPRLMRIGRRVFITPEAIAEWRNQRTAA